MLQNNIKIILIFLSVMIACFEVLSPKLANAQTLPQQSLRVTPIINDLKLVPGKQTSFPLTLENVSQDSVGIHAEISGFDVTGETPLTDQKISAMVPWTHLSQEDILLNSHEKKTIWVRITLPKKIGQSGYYETILLTPMLHQKQLASSPVVLSRIAVLILGTVGNLNYDELAKKVSIIHIDPSHIILNSFPQTISFAITNSYFTHFDAKPFLTLTPLFGKSQTILLADKHVLPGNSRTWEYQSPIKTSINFYRLHLAVSIGGGKQIMADTWFMVFPYKIGFAILFVLLILVFVIIKRKSFGKFITILIRG